MADSSITLDATASFLFVGNSFTFGRVDPVMSYNTDEVRDMTAPVPGTSFANTTGSNDFEPHPWGGIPGIFKEFADQAGLTLDVAISTRNAASLQGHYLNGNPAGWDLRGNVASQRWDTLVLQDNSTQALPSGAATITFAPGASVARLVLGVVGDTKAEGGTPNGDDPLGLETVGLQIAAGTGYTVGTTSFLTGTIYDGNLPAVNPALPTVTVVASPSAVFEDGAENLVYSFTRTGPSDTALVVSFNVLRSGSTGPSVAVSGANQDLEVAANGTVFDYQSGGAATTGSVSFTTNTGTIVIPAGQTSATLTLNPKPDAIVEPDEWMRVTLTSPSANYNIGTPGALQVTILNDDGLPGGGLPNITGRLTNGTVYEDAGGNLVWEFTRTGPTTDALSVNLAVNGTATLTGNDFTVTGANSFRTAGAENPNLTSFQTYAVKLAEYATTGLADGAIAANPNANAATNVFLYETWARARDIVGATRTETDEITGEITSYPIASPEYYTSLEDMTADLRAAYEGLGASNPIFKGVAPVGAAFLSAVQQGLAIRDPFTETIGDAVGNISLWWDDNFHPSKYGSYLSAATLFGTLTGVDPRSLGAGDRAAAELGIDPAVAAALQNVAAATVGFTLQANWTAPGQVTELQGTATGLLASAGAFGFSDTGTADVHTVSVAPVTVGALGTLTASLHSDSTGDGTGGAVNWTYTVDNAAIAYLVAGQTRVEQFLVTVADQNGGLAQRQIDVTVTGVADGGEDGPNVFYGNAGSDTFFGLGGSDQLFGAGGADALYGGDGNDLISGGAGADYLSGGAGSDVFLYGPATDSTLSAYDMIADFETGIDTLDLRFTDATSISLVRSGPGTFVFADTPGGLMAIGVNAQVNASDVSYTGSFGIYMVGSAAADTLIGSDRADTIQAGAGDDVITGGRGGDVIFGEAGADTFRYLSAADSNMTTGSDTLFGFETGIDRIDLAALDATAVSLVRSGGSTFLFANSSSGPAFVNSVTDINASDLMVGGRGVYMVGDVGNDVLVGGDGPDTIVGGAGNDLIQGGGGNDYIFAGLGVDAMFGGDGADVFGFTSVDDSRANSGDYDTIFDFQTGIDKIDLRSLRTGASDTVSSYSTEGTTFVFASFSTGDMAIILKGTASITDADILF